nr:retrovirus-related Pol polyprotein from transposon TNT 1-94 [Tanacetum cinerariifolium]
MLKGIATTTIVPPREPILIASNIDKPVITLFYSGKSKAAKKVPVSNSTINKSLKLKGKAIVDNAVTTYTIDPEMLKVDVQPIAPRLLNNRTVHSDYLRITQEQAVILKEELLILIRQTCLRINNSSDKLVAVTPKNKDKIVRFTEPVTSSGNKNKKIASSSNLVSNKPMLSSTGVKSSTSASGSQPSGNTKKDKIYRPPSSTKKNKVEAHPRTVKSSLKNKNCAVEPKETATVQHSKLNANSKFICVKCHGFMLSDNHALCVLNAINDVNARFKSKSAKKHSKRKVWKPTGMVFTKTGYTWRPTGRTFTIVENACPLTRITTTAKVPLRKPTALETDTPKPVVTLVYSRKPWKSKSNVPVSKPKIIKSKSANNKEPSKSPGSIVSDVPSSSLDKCRSSKLFSGLRHNLFFVGQLCDSNLEVAFRRHTCFIRNLEGIDLLTGSRGNNLYTLSLRDIMASSPICLLSKALKTNSWLRHHRLSHLNFGTINHLARHGLVRGFPKLKFEKDHLCSACAMGKSKKKPYKPKSKDTNQEKLYLLHMDLCGLMRVASVNGKKYILVIVDDYSRFTWKPTGKVFTNIGYIWRPTGRTFTIVGNTCPLTRFTTTTEVPSRNPVALEIDTPKPVVTLVYSRKPRKPKTTDPVSKSKHMTEDCSQLTNFVNKFLGTVKFGNDHMAKIMGYGDYHIRNVTILRVYYVEGLGHNLFSVRQLSRHGLIRDLPKLKLKKDHLCSACAMGKSKKKPYKSKSEDTNQEKLYLLHMDLYGPMRVASVNGNKYILIIVDDYSRFT